MKWRYPVHGDTRRYAWFAWYPVRCEDGYIRWLETVVVRGEFRALRRASVWILRYYPSLEEAP